MSLWRVVAVVIGLIAVAGTTVSVVTTLIVPRASTAGLSRMVSLLCRGVFLTIARPLRAYTAKDRVLALLAPVSLLLLLLVWLGAYHLSWTLVLWGVSHSSVTTALREAGSSLLTLGFASTESAPATVVDLATAATGLIVVALQVAYLPVLYGAFTARESLVTMLQSRAGSPAWGPEIIARHTLVGTLDNLPRFFDEWEVWAAQLAESHTNYPVLIGFRSPHHLRSWIIALLAVMDAAALHLALSPSTAPSECRLCLRMGFTALRDIADVARIPYDPDPTPEDGIQLGYREYLDGVERLLESGYVAERTPEEGWLHFQGWRVNYEPIAYALAELVVAPPAPWSGARRRLAGVVVEPIRPIDRRPGGDVRRSPIPRLPT